MRHPTMGPGIRSPCPLLTKANLEISAVQEVVINVARVHVVEGSASADV